MAEDPNEKYVTVGEFRRVTGKLAIDLLKTQEDVAHIKETMATKSDIQRILGAIDSFAGKLDTYSRESVTLPATLDSHGKTLREHEKRITKLESA